jgi:hypothetical protein
VLRNGFEIAAEATLCPFLDVLVLRYAMHFEIAAEALRNRFKIAARIPTSA